MLVHPLDPERTLLELADVLADPPPPSVAGHEGPLREIAAWLREYLCRPHPALGRSGNVCPYAPGALDRGLIYLRVQPGDPHPDDLDADLLELRDWFLELSVAAERQSIFVSIVTVFPDLEPQRVVDVIEGTQRRLKGEFVKHGAMIGEFHPGPPERAGLWNPEFRPFACPQPVLAMRHMVGADFLFVEDDDDHVQLYLRRFGDSVPPHLRARVAARTGETPS